MPYEKPLDAFAPRPGGAQSARTRKHMPTSREAKYKAKAAIDAFFMRFGDVLQAGIVYLGTALGFVLSSFAALNLAFTAVWFMIAAALAREYKKRVARSAAERALEQNTALKRSA